MKLDDIILMAYVDGELDAETVADIEDQLAVDAEARRKVALLRQSASLVRAALSDVVHQETPAWVTAAMAKTPPPAARRPRVYAIAASLLALAIGLGGGILAADFFAVRDGPRRVQLAEGADTARNEMILYALANQPSGTTVRWSSGGRNDGGQITMIRTYRNSSRQYCREFREDDVRDGAPVTAFEVRCRAADGNWEPQYRLIPLKKIASPAGASDS